MILARPLEELTKIIRLGEPIILRIVAEEVRVSWSEPPAQATIVEIGILLGDPSNKPPYFDNDKLVPNNNKRKSLNFLNFNFCHHFFSYIASIDENSEPGTIVTFSEPYSTKVKDEDIGKAGVFALKLINNNGTFEINPTVAERIATFVITVRDNTLIDYEKYKSLRFMVINFCFLD